ncbi:hypothetical protein ACQPZF_18725 [Actinosynnema sp. CS-041913]|uniref:hypothetical protein n=1 Tax=Actinosynnema sp. CS-041913 TaxID=3239917 RepID=UPI003D8C2BB9
MYRFHPQQRRVVELLHTGEIGGLRVVRAAFHQAVLTHTTPLVSLADSKRTARVGEALVKSARTNTEVTL